MAPFYISNMQLLWNLINYGDYCCIIYQSWIWIYFWTHESEF